jgi:ketosteroid isomerase-like protein
MRTGTQPGLDDAAIVVRAFNTAWNGHDLAASLALTSDDRVVQRWRYDWAAGHVRGIDVFTVRDGKVTEKLAYVNG